MREFEAGEPVYVTKGKHKGEKVEVTFRHNLYDPMLYSVITLDRKIKLALYQTELESVYQHDLRVGLITK